MQMLASIEGQVVALVIAGIVALINWMMKKPEAGDALPAPRSGADAEAERMRKFMEALGLPANQAPRPVPAPALRRAPPAPPTLPRARSLTPAPRLPVGQLHVPELRVPEIAEFHTKSAEVSAIPMESKTIPAPDPYAGTPRQAPVDEMRRLLRSPADIRAAILLREILGPPRGLLPSVVYYSNSSVW